MSYLVVVRAAGFEKPSLLVFKSKRACQSALEVSRLRDERKVPYMVEMCSSRPGMEPATFGLDFLLDFFVHQILSDFSADIILIGCVGRDCVV